MPAKLPEELFKTEPRPLSELSVGDRGRVFATDMHVDVLGECYLNSGAPLQSIRMPGVTIQVERREDGFHVTAHPKCSWEKRPLDPNLRWIPVVSVTISNEGFPHGQSAQAKSPG